MSKTIVFFGTEDFSATAFKNLINQYPVELVITKPDSIRGRGRKVQPPLIKKIALENDIRVLQPLSMKEAEDAISELVNPLGVLVSYGKIIPQSTLDLFPNGIVNIHPSLLPKYRGPSPIESAIYNGDDKTGVSLMYLVRAMDAGPVISQQEYPLDGTETQESLYQDLADIGSELLLKFLATFYGGGEIQSTPQVESEATYSTLLSKSMTKVDPATMTAQEIERKIRAHHPYPKTSLQLLGQDRIIISAHTIESKTDSSIQCKSNTWLEVDRLISTSGKTITLADLKNSLANRQ